jgi:cell shape-determining protein MreC
MKRKDIILLVIPMFFLVLVWILFSIYHNSVSSTISESLNVQITPIEGSFDQNSLNELKKRKNLLPIFEATGSASATEGASLE